MIQLNDYNSAVSEQELVRRRTGAQKIMEEKGVDCLLLVAHNNAQGSAVRYFADWIALDPGAYVMLPQKGRLTIWNSGGKGKSSVPPYAARDYEQSIGFPYFPAFPFTNDIMPNELVRYVRERGFRVIGLYRQSLVSFLIMDALRDAGCQFVSLDEEIDLLQAVKSPEEIAVFRRMSALHDDLYAACRCFVRPGRTEHEIAVDIKKAALDQSCEELNIMIGAGDPIGKHKPYFLQNHQVKKGDNIDLLVECTGPGGFFSEVSRMWSLGKPSDELRRAFDDAMEIQLRLAAMAKPGLPASEIMRQLHQYQDAHGYFREMRLFCHSQGYDVVMRPCCMLDETMILQENMVMSIHPCMENDHIFAMVTDNFLITKNGAELLNRTPREIFVVDC